MRAIRRPGGSFLWSALAPVLMIGYLAAPLPADAQTVRLQADDWVAECGTPEGDCSIIRVFRNTSANAANASFSLLIDLRNGQVAVVGKPDPTRATIQIDKYPSMQCVGTPYCIFSSSDAEVISRQLQTGSLILIDVTAGKSVLRSSLSTKGYRIALAKFQANGFRNSLK